MKTLQKLMQMMSENFIFVSDFEEIVAPKNFKLGYKPEIDPESNALIAENQDFFMLQSTTLKKGNNVEVQIRTSADKTEKVSLQEFDLFNKYEVVIMTSGEKLIGFAPIVASKIELAAFALSLQETELQSHDMLILAKWLYQHNPAKEQSNLDDLLFD